MADVAKAKQVLDMLIQNFNDPMSDSNFYLQYSIIHTILMYGDIPLSLRKGDEEFLQLIHDYMYKFIHEAVRSVEQVYQKNKILLLFYCSSYVNFLYPDFETSYWPQLMKLNFNVPDFELIDVLIKRACTVKVNIKSSWLCSKILVNCIDPNTGYVNQKIARLFKQSITPSQIKSLLNLNDDFTNNNYLIELIMKLGLKEQKYLGFADVDLQNELIAKPVLKAGDYRICKFLNLINPSFKGVFQIRSLVCSTVPKLNCSLSNSQLCFLQILNSSIVVLWVQADPKFEILTPYYFNLKSLSSIKKLDNEIKLQFNRIKPTKNSLKQPLNPSISPDYQFAQTIDIFIYLHNPKLVTSLVHHFVTLIKFFAIKQGEVTKRKISLAELQTQSKTRQASPSIIVAPKKDIAKLNKSFPQKATKTVTPPSSSKATNGTTTSPVVNHVVQSPPKEPISTSNTTTTSTTTARVEKSSEQTKTQSSPQPRTPSTETKKRKSNSPTDESTSRLNRITKLRPATPHSKATHSLTLEDTINSSTTRVIPSPTKPQDSTNGIVNVKSSNPTAYATMAELLSEQPQSTQNKDDVSEIQDSTSVQPSTVLEPTMTASSFRQYGKKRVTRSNASGWGVPSDDSQSNGNDTTVVINGSTVPNSESSLSQVTRGATITDSVSLISPDAGDYDEVMSDADEGSTVVIETNKHKDQTASINGRDDSDNDDEVENGTIQSGDDRTNNNGHTSTMTANGSGSDSSESNSSQQRLLTNEANDDGEKEGESNHLQIESTSNDNIYNLLEHNMRVLSQSLVDKLRELEKNIEFRKNHYEQDIETQFDIIDFKSRQFEQDMQVQIDLIQLKKKQFELDLQEQFKVIEFEHRQNLKNLQEYYKSEVEKIFKA
ncbi:hypothetical protein DFJ63DRAFT_213566 [Scheffersomyces coipomensis]|uniref:uncharacterized protein n=1 Tax=Scheffersomyces coipomensis TaxID=1788519 RepID=UPI00315CD44E